MSPESNETVQSIAERQYNQRFATEARHAIRDQIEADAQGDDDSIDRINIFLDRVVQDAEAGNVQNRKGEPIDGEQMQLQLQVFLLDHIKAGDPNNTEKVQPLVNIPRAGGLRDAFAQFESSNLSNRFIKALHERTGIPMPPEKKFEGATLADVQEDMGGEALDAVGAHEPIPAEDPLQRARNVAEGFIDKIPDHIKNPAGSIPEARPVQVSDIPRGEAAAPAFDADQEASAVSEVQPVELEENERLYRYHKANLDALYKELRDEESKPIRDENAIASLGRDIKSTKEAAGHHARLAAKKKAEKEGIPTVWH